MRNLLNSTELATLFLDSELCVRRFTTPTAKIIKLIPTDAGRPITDITTDLDYPTLPDDTREVLRTLVFKETQISSRSGSWYTVRIMPYRTFENVIDGVVITFTDITASKRLEAKLRDQASQLRHLMDSLPTLMWSATADGACTYLSRQWIEYTGVEEHAQHGLGWLGQLHPDDQRRVHTEWSTAVAQQTPMDTELRIRSKTGSFRWFTARAVPIRSQQGVVDTWYGACSDVDELRRSRQVAADRLHQLREWVAEPAFALDHDLVITSANTAAVRMLGREDLVGRLLLDVVGDAAPLVAKIREAIQRGCDLTFVVAGPDASAYHALALPHDAGATVLIRTGEELEMGQGREPTLPR
jgi:PAS domain S-box-containing protein